MDIKKVLSVIIALLVIGGAVWGYFVYKKHEVKETVHEYLIKKGTQENQITVLNPFIANLQGDNFGCRKT
ncbi:hypothetical protein QUF84_03980 [Fictibacillus enclensis]|uniref:hypothetical protein n=1 Tax=Fictibacillus enclensis TaxID=1017270 RepID=UPI0025A00055|nr:hypothetical protein [Fictibacillus enclensis]MDM5336391.1 hypothetical protein [Fictibacillus enclensis]